MTTTLSNESPLRYLCFDFGLKRIGVASGNNLLKKGNELAPIQARDGIPDWNVVTRLVEEWQPDLFVVGLPLNMDGTALYEAIAALFIANLVGIELTFMQQLIVFLTAMMASMGAPGIPSAGMVTMVLVLQAVGLPAEAIAILIPIDRALDTFRTMVNVEGDMVGSLVVQKWIKRDE